MKYTFTETESRLYEDCILCLCVLVHTYIHTHTLVGPFYAFFMHFWSREGHETVGGKIKWAKAKKSKFFLSVGLKQSRVITECLFIHPFIHSGVTY